MYIILISNSLTENQDSYPRDRTSRICAPSRPSRGEGEGEGAGGVEVGEEQVVCGEGAEECAEQGV